MKTLIEDTTTEQFKAWAESVLSTKNTEETGFHSGPAVLKIIEQMGECEAFKQYLNSGYEAFLINAAKIAAGQSMVSTMLGESIALQCLHHDRIVAGFMMGFKYAMYLHEQRALQELNK